VGQFKNTVLSFIWEIVTVFSFLSGQAFAIMVDLSLQLLQPF